MNIKKNTFDKIILQLHSSDPLNDYHIEYRYRIYVDNELVDTFDEELKGFKYEKTVGSIEQEEFILTDYTNFDIYYMRSLD